MLHNLFFQNTEHSYFNKHVSNLGLTVLSFVFFLKFKICKEETRQGTVFLVVSLIKRLRVY